MRSRVVRTMTVLGMFLGVLALSKVRFALETYRGLRESLSEFTGVDIAQIDQWVLLSLVPIADVLLMRGVRPAAIADELGLLRPIMPALRFALLATLPMMVGYALTGDVRLSWWMVVTCAIYPFIEELFFRGWAFRQLCERAKWGFWPAAVVTGLVFGLAHVPMSRYMEMSFGMGDVFTVLITGAGGVFFAWLFVKWNWNLWVPFLVHALMNTWWAIFASADGAVGGLQENIFRALTIIAAILLTIYRERIPGLRSQAVSTDDR